MQPLFLIQFFGLCGGLAAVTGAIISAVVYTGTSGERYSPLNHFISELGEVGVSRLAWLFNGALILSGLLLAPCCLAIGIIIPGWLSKAGMAAGIGASTALALVGVFPMNRLKPHIIVSQMYFRLGLVMSVLFTLAIAAQSGPVPIISRAVAWYGLPAILAYAAFIIYGAIVFRRTKNSELEVNFTNRPRLWPLAILEWMIFLTTVLWFAAIALGL